MAEPYSPFKFSNIFEDEPKVDIDFQAIALEMTRRVNAVEEKYMTTVVVQRLRELGWTVIEPHG